MKLRKRAFGLALGLTWGFSVLFITLWLIIMGSPGNTISKLGGIYLWYTYSAGGAILGFIWGFIHGFIFGFVLAWFYNLFAGKLKSKGQVTLTAADQ